MDQSTVDEFFEARLYIESIVAFLAAKKAAPEDIKDLQDLDRQMAEDLMQNNLADFVEKDLDFHLLIAKASKNRVLARVIQIIRDLVHDVVGDTFENDLDSLNSILMQNRKIIKAIQNHDAGDARKCMEDHIMFVEKTIHKTKQS